MSNLIKILPVGAEMLRVERRTDGWTDIAKVNSRFSQFCEWAQKLLILRALSTTYISFHIYPQ
jgi:hypothetical protein